MKHAGIVLISTMVTLWSACTLAAELTCVPSTGTLPFTSTMTATIGSRTPGLNRSIASVIDIELANGGLITGWRSGVAQLPDGGSVTYDWDLTLPAVVPLGGFNRFILTSEDVTPAPFNQPPYPPSGSRGGDTCLVHGLSP